MAGHSHWANIQHKKGAVDAKRGKLWSKLSRAIIVAAKSGGGDPSMNLKLRYAIDKAKQGCMPKDTIERAIKRGTGEIGGEQEDEVTYEGFGPGGVAVVVDALTNNRARTTGCTTSCGTWPSTASRGRASSSSRSTRCGTPPTCSAARPRPCRPRCASRRCAGGGVSCTCAGSSSSPGWSTAATSPSR